MVSQVSFLKPQNDKPCVKGKTTLLKTSLKMDEIEIIDEPMSDRKNPSVFRYQNKVYVMGGTWQHPGTAEKTDVPVHHNIIYFKSDGRISRVDLVQQNRVFKGNRLKVG